MVFRRGQSFQRTAFQLLLLPRPGLPQGWTDARTGAVRPDALKEILPEMEVSKQVQIRNACANVAGQTSANQMRLRFLRSGRARARLASVWA